MLIVLLIHLYYENYQTIELYHLYCITVPIYSELLHVYTICNLGRGTGPTIIQTDLPILGGFKSLINVSVEPCEINKHLLKLTYHKQA
jgi:hypothetical protein